MKTSIFYIIIVTFIGLTGCEELFKNEQGNLDELVWVGQASGPRQCVAPTFTSLDDAVEKLRTSNIEVFDSTEADFGVCAACSCPTGIVFYAQISASDLPKAIDNGWSEIAEDDIPTEGSF